MRDLKKSIGPLRGTAMMLNIVLGAGLLTLPGLAAKQLDGFALFVWLACAISAAPLLWVFAIMGRRYPDAGGIAAGMGLAFGHLGRNIATFLFLGAVFVGLPAIALTGGHYAASALGGPVVLYAEIILFCALAVNFLPSDMGSRINTIIASFIIVFICAIALLGWLSVQHAPAIYVNYDALPPLSQLGTGFMMIFFAFTGWEVSANLSGEFAKPKRDLPIAMGLSFIIAVALYFCLALVVAKSGAIGIGAAPFAQIFHAAYGAIGSNVVSAVAVLLIFANLSAAIWAVSRMVYAAGRDRILPSYLGKTRNSLPFNAIKTTFAILIFVVLLGGLGILALDQILAAAGQNFLLLYAGAAAALFKLEQKWPYRLLCLFCITLVGALFIGRGGTGILYPAILTAAAWVRSKAQNKHAF